MKKIVIFTSFADLQKAYSLNIIVQTQIKMLLLNGYEPTVIVHESFVPEGIYAHPNVRIEKIPNVPCHNEVKKDETFDKDVDTIYKRLKEILADADVVLTHDIVYQNAALKHNFASRQAAKELPNVKWLHWIHSATAPNMLNVIRPIFSDQYLQLVQTPFPNARYVYPNKYAIPSVAKNFGVSNEEVVCVHHATDICDFLGISKEVEQLVYEKDLLMVDAMATYPCRLDGGKQVEMVIKTMAMLKGFGLTIRVVVVDFHSTGGEKLTYRDRIKQIAIDYGLSENELIWTSEQRKEWHVEVPQSVVRDFQLLSNVFIMPSVSETFSLVAQEAALLKQVLVLNQDFPPFRSIYGEDAIYAKYSSRADIMADISETIRGDSETRTEYGPSNAPQEARKEFERMYHRGIAGQIAARLKHPEMAMSRKLMKERNLDAVFKKELEVLFYE